MRTTKAHRPTRCSPWPRRSPAAVEVPVTVDAEAGYGMEPPDVVAALQSAGAAGCNLEDTDHATGSLRDPDRQAEWLRAVREAASQDGYQLVINARVWTSSWGLTSPAPAPGPRRPLVPEALRRASAYIEAGVDCVFPIVLREPDALQRFMSEIRAPVNVIRGAQSRVNGSPKGWGSEHDNQQVGPDSCSRPAAPGNRRPVLPLRPCAGSD
jgi:2-methylisocitrate lyase-like PEP mutase family enzyme